MTSAHGAPKSIVAGPLRARSPLLSTPSHDKSRDNIVIACYPASDWAVLAFERAGSIAIIEFGGLRSSIAVCKYSIGYSVTDSARNLLIRH